MVALMLAMVLQGGTADVSGVRTPAVSMDGRVAVSVRGDLWVLPPSGGPATRVTEGAAWDRDPAWTGDGRSLVFASDRAGSMDLWRVDLDAGTGPVALTSGPGSDTEPTVLPDGRIAFVRGTAAAADIWLLGTDGTATRLTSAPGPDRSPAASVTGRIAWVEDRMGTGGAVRVREVDGSEHVFGRDLSPIRVSWSPDGRLLAIGSAGRTTAGVWVGPAEGTWLAPASAEPGVAAWSADGEWLYIANADDPDVGYNGDPDRLGGRMAGDVLDGDGGLRRVRAPRPPDDGAAEIVTTFALPRASLNAEAFDRVWDRTARLYLGWTGTGDTTSTASLRAWRDAARRYRPDALTAATPPELDEAVDRLLAARPPLRPTATGRAAVSSAHPLATAAGVEILQAGGNVVDAAVAVSFALGVVEPDASGPGGYGEMLIQLEGMPEPTAIEFMTKVPLGATPDNPALENLPSDGPMRVNVPGTIAGMEAAWRKYGSRNVTWAEIVAPAIRIAERGFVLDDAFATTLRREWEAFAQYESSQRLFFRDGRPLQAGDTLRNPDLAWVLRQVANAGADAFYRGEVARRLVEDLQAGGNPISLEDMARYTAAERRPVHTTYRGNDVYSGPPPVTGGVSLVAKLNLLEQAPAGASIRSDATKLHAMIEAWKLQPSSGGRIGDPDSRDVDVTPFESKDTARARWACFDPEHALNDIPRDVSQCVPGPAESAEHTSEGLQPCVPGPDPRACRSTGTTAFAVADRDGNMVAVTQTLGTWGGNFYVSPGLGFLYNDKLVPPRGGRGSGPGTRVGTVIAPTLIYRGSGQARRPLMALGAAGNAWITSAVYEIVIGVLDHGLGPQAALEQPRFLPGGRGGPIQIEDGFGSAAIRQLEAMGHLFRPISLRGELRMGYGAAVLVEDGRVTAGADPRRSGAAGAVR